MLWVDNYQSICPVLLSFQAQLSSPIYVAGSLGPTYLLYSPSLTWGADHFFGKKGRRKGALTLESWFLSLYASSHSYFCCWFSLSSSNSSTHLLNSLSCYSCASRRLACSCCKVSLSYAFRCRNSSTLENACIISWLPEAIPSATNSS